MNSRQAALLLLSGLAEASLVLPLILILPTPLRLFDHTAALAVTWAVICLLAGTRRFLGQVNARWNTQRIVMGAWLAGLLLAFLAGLELAGIDIAPFDAALVVELTGVLLLWWRGLALGASDLQPEDSRLRLQIGLVLFVLFAVASMLDRNSALFAFIVPFLVGAVLAMPLSHLERVDQNRLGRRIRMDGVWWRSIALGAGAPIALSLIAVAVITGDTLTRGLQLLIGILMLPLVLLAMLVGTLLAELLRMLFRQPLNLSFLTSLGEILQQFNETPGPSESGGFVIPEAVRIALVIAAVALFIVFVAWSTGRAQRAQRAQQAETESLQVIESEEAISGLERLRQSLSLRRWLAALTIRRIYARMAHEAGRRGFPRLPAQTPSDYAPALRQAFPGADAEIERITAAYIAAHYGEVPDTDEALAAIRAAWERARASRPQTPAKRE